MTQEEKSILIKDLSARLPYEVKIETQTVPRKLFPMDLVCDELPRPYLRPMSSMTQRENVYYECYKHYVVEGIYSIGNKTFCIADYFDYINQHHFDYRGLIEKGLALPAPPDMYKID